MAFLDEEFDATSVPQSEHNYEPVPAGWYSAIIFAAEIKETKSGTGSYIKVRYDITGPTHEGRVVFGNLNIRNQSTQAEEIGRQQFSELLLSIGMQKIKDTDQLIGGQLMIKLAVKPANGQYEASNEVKGYKALDNAATQQAPTQQSQPIKPAGGSAPPWARK